MFRFLLLLLPALPGLLYAPGAYSHTDADGGQIYQQFCSVCHGDRGAGASHARQGLYPPPRDFTDPAQTAHLDREHMLDAVRNGRPGTAMTAWSSRLDDDQIAAVVDYIREQFMPASSYQRGQQIYAQNCSVCHGDQGAGANWGQDSMNPPPRDFTTAQAGQELSRERMLIAVTYGRPGTAMQAFGKQLSDADIAAVVDYIRDAFMQAGPTIAKADEPRAAQHAHGGQEPDHHADAQAGSAHAHAAGYADMAAPFPDGLIGDVKAGKAFYLANCATCHGRDGDGDGPRAYFIRPRPRNFLHPTSRLTFNRPHLFHATKDGVIGREMPAWGKVLSDQQIADVSEYVLQRFILGRDVQ